MQKNELLKLIKSPDSNQEIIESAIHSYFKRSFNILFSTSFIKSVKKLNREFIFKFMFDHGYFYSAPVYSTETNPFLIFNPTRFYIDPISLMNDLEKVKNKNNQYRYIFDMYFQIFEVVNSQSSLHLTISSIQSLKSYNLLYQKFIILNFFKYENNKQSELLILQQATNNGLLNFLFLILLRSNLISSRYIAGQLESTAFFNNKFFPEKTFVLFLININKIHQIPIQYLFRYIYLDEIQTYLKTAITDNKIKINLDNAHMTHMAFEKNQTNLNSFFIFLFENTKPIFINKFFNKGGLFSYHHDMFKTQKEHFIIFKNKFELLCQSDFNPKLISHKQFFINIGFRKKESITKEQMKELVDIVFKYPDTLNKFKKNLKYIDIEFRAFFILDDF